MRWPKYPSPFEAERMFRDLPRHSSLAAITIGGFTRYKTEVSELPESERNKVDAIADAIIASYLPGRYRYAIIATLLVGHADQDLARGRDFEHKVSVERAEKVRDALVRAIQNRSRSRAAKIDVITRAVGVGAAERVVAFPSDEAQRARNRRVAIYLAESFPDFWTFWTIGSQRYQPEFVNAVAGSGSRAPAASGGIPFFINPDVFDFAPDPKAANWQTTSCVAIIFGYGSFGLPRMEIKVGVIVGAPRELRDGKVLSVREAQLDSANAAEAAALIIKGMLDAGTIGLSEIQPRFTGFTGGAIMTTGLGYRVRGCFPKTE
jgi:outer membrane protein OmpA-like peptidoglycan-associated protein